MCTKSSHIRVPLCAVLSLVWLALSACTTVASAGTRVMLSPSPLPASATLPAARTETATVPPSPTSTVSPTPTSTAVLPALRDDTIKEQVDKLAAWYLGQGRNSALSVAVVTRDAQTGQLEAMLLNYGTLSKDKSAAVTSDTIYEIGSITKVFTGILLAQAVSAGDVRLDDPIQLYLPSGVQAPSYQSTPITLLDLATHRSALPRDADSDAMPDIYNWLNTYELPRAPGSEYAYSNLGYSLLGDILARRAGKPFSALEFQAVSRPLGLTDTREALNDEQEGRLAQGYTYDGSPAGYFPQSGAMSSAGYLHSTLKDMTRFLIANMDVNSTQLAAPISMTQALEADRGDPGTGVGLGWEIDQIGTTSQRMSKGGATYGFTSYISFLSDGSSGFVLLSNGMYVEGLVPHMIGIIGGN